MIDLIFINGAMTNKQILNTTNITCIDISINCQQLLIENGFYNIGQSELVVVNLENEIFEASVVTIGDNRLKYLSLLSTFNDCLIGIVELKVAFNNPQLTYFILP